MTSPVVHPHGTRASDPTAGARAPVPTSELLPLLVQGASLLLANAETTERTVAAGEGLAQALGAQAMIMPRWDELIVQVEPRGGAPSEVAHVAPVGIDMTKVIEAERVIDDVSAGRLSPRDAQSEFARIAALPPVSLGRFVLAAAVAGCALAVIHGAERPSTFPLIALSAGAGALLRRGLSYVSPHVLLQPFGAALLAGLIGGLARHEQLGSAQMLIALCPCMVLVPGPHFLNGFIDLARARVAMGCARIAFALLVSVAIASGLLLGLWISGGELPIAAPSRPVPLPLDVIAAGLAVGAYASLYSMPWRYIPIPMVIGVVAHTIRWSVLAHGASAYAAAFLGCLFVGVVASPVALRLRLPIAAMAFAAVVSLMPGVFLFRMAAGLATMASLGGDAAPGLADAVLVNAATAVLIILAMGSGLVLPTLAAERPRTASSGTDGARRERVHHV